MTPRPSQLHRKAEHYARLSCSAALAELGARPEGLAPETAAERVQRFGPNELPRAVGPRWSRRLAAQFFNLFAILLWTGAGLALLAGLPQLTWAITAVILVNGSFSFWQEYRAERAVQALSLLLPQRVMVRRGAAVQQIPATELVPGDILLLAEGDAIAADARILSCHGLRVDLSSLTGESHAVPRSAQPESGDKVEPARMSNLVFAGTTVQSGRGEAVVFQTGASTELSRIAELTHAQRDRPSPLELELVRVTRVVTVLAVATGLVFFAIGTSLGGLSALSGFVFAIGIIVAFVPEGLLPTLTLALALGVRRMAARNAVVRRLSSVEALGATTLILTDKTGTLTQNEMTVRELWTPGAAYEVTGLGLGLSGEIRLQTQAEAARPSPLESELAPGATTELLRVAALCCDAHLLRDEREPRRFRGLGDPTECAILVAASKAGIYPELLGSWPRLAELPFDSARKRMTTIHGFGGRPVACVKGACSEVLPLCTAVAFGSDVRALDGELTALAQTAHKRLAERGFRVLAVARRPLPGSEHSWNSESVERDLVLLGFIAMEDPPRPEVAPALAACHRAGVRVLMVTGDSGLTAQAIGAAIGMYRGPARVITGAELQGLDDEQLDLVLAERELLFARATPEDKLRLVQAYQRRGEVVAVTGDGVNDAPALKRADVGVAMGETGTDVARAAADMVLTDDNFATIVGAIEEGRGVYDNVRKFMTYIFASNVPEAVPFIASVLLGIPLPLTVMQILAVDLGTDLFPALALGAEAPERDVMRRLPRSRAERLLNASTLLRACVWLGSIQALLAMSAYYFAYRLGGWQPGSALPSAGAPYAIATTMTFAGIVACQLGNLFACRSAHESAWSTWPGFLRRKAKNAPTRPLVSSNRLLWYAVVFELTLLATLIYVPPLARVFGLAPLSVWHWLFLAGFGPTLFLLEEARKSAVRRLALTTGRRAPKPGANADCNT